METEHNLDINMTQFSRCGFPAPATVTVVGVGKIYPNVQVSHFVLGSGGL